MPLVAAAIIYVGGVGGVVAGLTYASAALYVAGKVTGNQTLMKLSAITGLAAGAAGIYNGIASAATLAEGASDVAGAAESGAEAASLAEGASAAAPAAETFSIEDPSAAFGGAESFSGAAPSFTSEFAGAPDAGSIINPTVSGATDAVDTGQIAQTALSSQPDVTSTAQAANNLTGDATAAQANTAQNGLINQPPQANAGMDLSLSPQADAQAQSFQPGASSDGNLNLPSEFGQVKDPSMLGKVRDWWGTLTPTEKNAASNFVAKGLGAMEDFVGPKAELTKAQAGLANSQSAMNEQQLANMRQPAMKIPKMAYTFNPRGG